MSCQTMVTCVLPVLTSKSWYEIIKELFPPVRLPFSHGSYLFSYLLYFSEDFVFQKLPCPLSSTIVLSNPKKVYPGIVGPLE